MEVSVRADQDKPSLDQLVGTAVKNDRNLAGMTLAELSRKSSVSTAMISKIERGQVSASLSTLNALAKAIGVPIINFFSNTVKFADVSYVAAGEGVNVRRMGSSFGHDYKLIGRAASKHIGFESFMVTLEQPLNPRPFYQHNGIEFIHVVEGSMSYRCGEETYVLEPGDSLSFESNTPHAAVTLNTQRVRFITVTAKAQSSDGRRALNG
jgi:transcriptional regulator with XRE-family HTH domain